MNNRIREKLSKLYELFQRGATAGEKGAAKEAIDRIVQKYDLDNIEFDELALREYRFKYSTHLEALLLNRLRKILLNLENDKAYRTNYDIKDGRQVMVRDVVMELNQFDYVTLHAAYEYFRRHMNAEWKRVALPEINKCRKPKTKARKRKQLQEPFFSRYVISSKLYKEEELQKVELKTRADCERESLLAGVEGGKYNRQVNNGLYLEE